jgi:hypothetical protein
MEKGIRPADQQPATRKDRTMPKTETTVVATDLNTNPVTFLGRVRVWDNMLDDGCSAESNLFDRLTVSELEAIERASEWLHTSGSEVTGCRVEHRFNLTVQSRRS